MRKTPGPGVVNWNPCFSTWAPCIGFRLPGKPGMHTTDTIDFEVILSGEVWLELDDGEEVHLREGDTFVQNGTRHRWFNRGKVPAKIAVVLIGGHPR